MFCEHKFEYLFPLSIVFMLYLKKHCLIKGCNYLLIPIYSWKIFWVSGVYFILNFSFMYGCVIRLQISSPAYQHPLSPVPVVVKAYLSPLNVFETLIQNLLFVNGKLHCYAPRFTHWFLYGSNTLLTIAWWHILKIVCMLEFCSILSLFWL